MTKIKAVWTAKKNGILLTDEQDNIIASIHGDALRQHAAGIDVYDINGIVATLWHEIDTIQLTEEVAA